MYVEIDAVSDAATDNTDSKSESSDCCDQVVGADDGGYDLVSCLVSESRVNDAVLTNDGRGNNDTTDAKSSNNEQTPDLIEVVTTGNGQRSAASGHEDGRDNHQFTVMATENRQEPEYETCTGQNAKSYWQSANAYTDRIVAVDVECLRRPEHDDREEVRSRDGGDDKSQGENARGLL